MKTYYVYILRCEDNSLYTGYTTDIEKRLTEHFKKSPTGAKYTKSHSPKTIEALWSCTSKSDAMKMEYHIKRLKKEQKELLISSNTPPLSLAFKLIDMKIERLTITKQLTTNLF